MRSHNHARVTFKLNFTLTSFSNIISLARTLLSHSRLSHVWRPRTLPHAVVDIILKLPTADKLSEFQKFISRKPLREDVCLLILGADVQHLDDSLFYF